MSAEQLFHRWVKIAIAVFVALFAYFVLADLFMPITTESRMQRYVVQVAPRVSGQIDQVMVTNNAHVDKGDVLFSIDPSDYTLNVEQAKLNAQQTEQKVLQLQASLKSAEATLEQSQVSYENAAHDVQRYQSLVKNGGVPVKQRDDALAVLKKAKAQLAVNEANIASIRAELGMKDGVSVLTLQAQNKLAQAELALSRTQVRAETSGFVSDLQLEAGTMAVANKPVIALVADDATWITADFREKSLLHVDHDTAAAVVFDALPGKVFPAVVQHRDHGVAVAQGTPDGELAKAEDTTRWVRDAQRVRLNLALTETPPNSLVVGSRATVQLLPTHNPIAHFFGYLQIYGVSLLHFIY
ncbi:HlyD family secretion protein [Pokkaliibacter sp. CJK22405]|uniref:HlyD family secretion protein n=1 Tax=Pokkaliibacter sp. CJK22405 TaxID=3384615 RepID=UPI003984901A